MKRTAPAVLLALCAAAAPARAAGKSAPPSGPRADYRISFELRSGDLSASGSFLAAVGTQANYVRGGETPIESVTASGRTVDFKKHGVIANCLPLAEKDGLVDLQCQFELSGPTAPVGELKVRPVETFQYQSEVLLRPGRPLRLVDERDRRVEVTVVRVAP
ncbi:MAG: hypothetical protein KGM24_13875 [Elusimicrobia bacterium]|nr:hypothetical protein [Elusimicrobiota bacterium]